MRIVGGEFRGRVLAAPTSNAIRPTTDRTRESLFNILAHAHPGVLDATRILDLFAGTGAVGIEALSRGAKSALFVENSVEGRSLLWENIDALGLHGRARILRRDATQLGPASNIEPFQLVFADALTRSWKQIIKFQPQGEMAKAAPRVELPSLESSPEDAPFASMEGVIREERGLVFEREDSD